MAQRRHGPRDRSAWSEASPFGRWRHPLGRRSGPGTGPWLVLLLLNPSTDAHIAGDATLARCMARARGLGFGALRVVNRIAWRATDPRALGRVPDPVGPENDAAIGQAARWGVRTLCDWDVRGGLAGRDGEVRRLLGCRPLWHLRLTAGGKPRHPLHLAAGAPARAWV